MSVLVVDLARILDESAAGRAGAQALQARFEAARASYQKLPGVAAAPRAGASSSTAAAEAAAFEQQELAAIEQERARLRGAVLAKARPVVEAIARERKASVVVDAAAVITCATGVDVTDEVIRRIDATR